MKKVLKTLATGALLASLATVAACGDEQGTTTQAPTAAPVEKYVKGNGNGATVNVGVNYVNSGYHFGVTYQDDAAKDLDGNDLLKGTKLPYWKEVEKQLNVTVQDAADYSFGALGDEWENYNTNGNFKLADGRQIDLIMADGSKSVTSGNKGLLTPVDELIAQGKLPNFKLWVDSHQSIWNSMKAADGHVYYVPYFDGFDNLEKMFLMDSVMVKKLLDDEVTFDTAKTVTTVYTPQVPSMTAEKIDVLHNGKVEQIEVTFGASENIIAVQNALSTKNGKTLTEALRSYIDAVYGDYIGAGKVYAKRSDIFFSAAACYNADELVALLRCANANPQLLTGTDTIYALSPRTGEANRQRQIAELLAMFGIRGRSGEKDLLYFDKDGVLQDGRTKEATYQGLDLLNAMYQEELFPLEYYKGFGWSGYKGDWRKNLMASGQVFMLYDYNATSTALNADSKDGNKANMQAVLPPVVKWDAGQNSGQQNYFHFSEDSRQLKSGGWAIPKEANNIDAVCAIVDYAWMPEGADLQDFGPNTTTYRNAVTQYDENGHRIAQDGVTTISINGKNEVKMSNTVLTNEGFIGGWNNWCRKFIGTTQGVGHVRSDALDYQSTTSKMGRDGLDKLSQAIVAGTFTFAKSNGENFFKAVPTTFAISSTDDAAITGSAEAKKMVTFWQEKNPKSSTSWQPCGYTYWICEGKNGANVLPLIDNYQSWVQSFAAVDAVYIKAYRLALLSAE